MADAVLESEPLPPRYIVGVDLGTSNCALAYVDTRDERPCVRHFPLPQLTAPGVVESRDTLPSCLYQRAAGELAAGALRLPWSPPGDDPALAVGVFARDQGVAAPGRLVASAKSWLCHSGVDRTAELLPWHAAADVPKLSPVAASARYLTHLRSAWDHAHPDEPLDRQDLILTLPASFDEVARELTVRAAAEAGLPRVVLIEEPQAAFYAWIEARGDTWDRHVAPGEKILVCDVGGGTSDFTLIHAREAGGGRVQFQRVAVGDHLILGGDNMDLALARFVEGRFKDQRAALDPRQWSSLVRVCREVKESLLAGDADQRPAERALPIASAGHSSPNTPAPQTPVPQNRVITLPGAGSRLIGGALRTEVTRDEVESLLVDGFFPLVDLADKPAARRSGFQEFGLPYAADAAITRYLAAFLTAHRGVIACQLAAPAGEIDPARPDAVLFNGGVFESPLLRERLVAALGRWFGGAAPWRPRVLENARLDLAVAFGAAYYGLVRRGVGVKIAAGLARSYYIGLDAAASGAPQESAMPGEPAASAGHAMCLVPAGTEEGATIDLAGRRFRLRIREPVEFPLYYSSTRLTDRPGELAPLDVELLTPLPPIRTVLQVGKKTAAAETIDVELHARLTEIGTLELWCSACEGPGSWRLQFDVRAATRTDLGGHRGAAEQAGFVDAALVDTARGLIEEAFGPAGASLAEGLAKRLSEALGMPRGAWPPSLLREMWDALLAHADARRRSPVVEARWLNLLGFALRPGFGMAVDDWRVAQTWRALGGRLIHSQPMCRAEWWILWRRIAGGLPAGQQRALADPLLAEIRAARRSLAKGRGVDYRSAAHETAETWRLLGALELLAPADKIDLGDGLLELAAREKTPALAAAALWSVGRVGARVPAYGPLNAAVPSDVAARWLQAILSLKRPPETTPLALMQLARLTGDRYRDIPDRLRSTVLARLHADAAPPHFIELVEQVGHLAEAEQGLILGDSLPRGLSLAG